MRSFKNVCLLLLAIIPSTAYIGKDVTPSVGLSVGDRAPEIKTDKTGNELMKLSQGRYLLLQFWTTYDARSRMNNLLMYNSVSQNYANRVVMHSFDFDSMKLIFDETLRTDGIRPLNQHFVAEGEKSEIFEKYELDKEYTNYLINPDGVIVAKNLTPETLSELIN